MDKLSKDQYIQAYLERQKAYVHSYTSEGLEQRPLILSYGTPTGVRHQDAKNPSFGFNTPVLLPRVSEPIVSPSTDKRRSAPAKATPRVRKAPDTGTSGKKRKSSKRASLNAIQCDSSKRKRKKDVIPSGSEDEREARLSERRARKRVKRAIVKPDIAVHFSPASDERENNLKKVPCKKAKKHSGMEGLALLHGLSATNVGKNRLTLKPLASLGVFNKGKSSTKTRVCNAKKSGQTSFSEFTFLGKTTTQRESLVDESIVRDSSSQPPSPSAKNKITNHRKDKKPTCSTSPHSPTPDIPRGTPARSEAWDIELQSKCPTSDSFSSQPDQHVAGSLILDPRVASWHDQGLSLSSKDQVMHSAQIATTVKETLHDCLTEEILSPAPASAIATVYDLDHNSSIHPSHSASQIGRKHLISPEELPLASRYFATHANHDVQRLPPMPDQPQQVECRAVAQHYTDNFSVEMSYHDAYPLPVSLPHYISASTMHRATALSAMDDSSPIRVHGIPQEQFLPFVDGLAPDYRSSSIVQSSCATKHDILTRYTPDECSTSLFEADMDFSKRDLRDHYQAFLEPPDLVNSLGFCSPVQVYSNGPHDISEVDMIGPLEHTQTRDTGDWEHSDVVLERSPSYEDSFESVSRSYTTAEACDDTSLSLHPFLQGRAMLLGILPYVPLQDAEKMSNGLLLAEVDVAKRLKDHWRPHRL